MKQPISSTCRGRTRLTRKFSSRPSSRPVSIPARLSQGLRLLGDLLEEMGFGSGARAGVVLDVGANERGPWKFRPPAGTPLSGCP